MADYYPDSGSEDFSNNATTASATSDTPENTSPDDKEEGDNTALVPNSFFGTDKEPQAGEICRVKIVHCYEDECEIQWLGPESEEEVGESDSGSEMGKAMGDLTSRADRESTAY